MAFEIHIQIRNSSEIDIDFRICDSICIRVCSHIFVYQSTQIISCITHCNSNYIRTYTIVVIRISSIIYLTFILWPGRKVGSCISQNICLIVYSIFVCIRTASIGFNSEIRIIVLIICQKMKMSVQQIKSKHCRSRK